MCWDILDIFKNYPFPTGKALLGLAAQLLESGQGPLMNIPLTLTSSDTDLMYPHTFLWINHPRTECWTTRSHRYRLEISQIIHTSRLPDPSLPFLQKLGLAYCPLTVAFCLLNTLCDLPCLLSLVIMTWLSLVSHGRI